MASIRALLLLLLLVAHVAAYTDSPIIGIVGLPQSEGCITRRRGAPPPPDSGRSCFAAYYSLWLAQAGARVVPLRYNMTADEVAWYAARLNGVLFTGGELDMTLQETYVKTARLWLAAATDPAHASDPLAVWGTCQGFQLLHVLVANDTAALCTNCFDADDISWPLNFTSAALTHSLYGNISRSSYHDFASQPISMNYHVSGIDPQLYAPASPFPALRRFFAMLSTNVDRKVVPLLSASGLVLTAVQGRPFVSSVQAREYPIFATQFHPERPAFSFSDAPDDEGLVHTRAAVQANNELAQVFVDVARRSSRSFGSFAAALPHLLYHLVPHYQGQSEQIYLY